MFTETSQSLLDRLQSNSSTHDWEVFYSIYHPFIRRHLLRGSVPESDVDDLSQDILARVFVALSSFQHNGRCGAFRCWLGKIVAQQRWQYLQHQKRHPFSIAPDATCRLKVISCDELQAIWEAEHDSHVLAKLMEVVEPEFTRSTWLAFVGVTLRGGTSAEVAQQLGLTPNAVMVAKSRVLSRLRALGRELLDVI
ncbi:MAG TPA: sigma-70 family RNA polymerase sigma factor [Pirellulaceae bacterium]|nr:sigma-70 family RNA polymerase sigma factor [Pirellulaceae bacterium]HMO92926.1 sigma-70 family RNA polymerase sigma factor [Pirellulaceae bacterium]HMP71053.1 sigma-70 family RNA polymerase sigma factor [Pirellulaceae bacterium]